MAFNPFSNFRKYRNFWMAAILLMTMITFVLCTGAGQGDLSDILQRLFRPGGSVYASIDGSSVRSQAFYELKDQRNIANEFMRSAAKFCIGRMDEILKPENFKKAEQNPKELKELQQVDQIRQELEKAIRPSRFFGGGVKIDELVDFKIMLAEANRLNVDLTNEKILALVNVDLVAGLPGLFGMDAYRYGLNEVRRNNNRANEAAVMEALRNEYKVRLAQRVFAYLGPTRLSMTPDQVWNVYKEKRAELRISLLPLHVEDFTAGFKAPDDVALDILFQQHKNHQYDPASDTPGFTIPGRVKVGWISADASSDHFKKTAKLAVQLRAMPPLPMNQLASFGFLVNLAEKSAAADRVYQGIGNRGRFEVGNWFDGDPDNGVAGWLTQKDPVAIAAVIGAGALRADAGFLAGGASVRSLAALGAQRKRAAFEAGVRELVRPRALAFATAVLLGTSNQGLALPVALDSVRKYDHLPLSVVEDEMLQVVENNQARDWIKQQMVALKKSMEAADVRTAASLNRAIDFAVNPHHDPKNKTADPKARDRTLKDIGLERGETKDYYHKYNIADAKELEPLKKAYLAYHDQINQFEGRDLAPETKLKPGDFWKVFFDGGESFSATGAKYQVKAWPPAVKVFPRMVQQARLVPNPNLIEDPRIRQLAIQAAATDGNQPVVLQFFEHSDQPILFWRIDDKPAFVPEKLADVRDQVIEAWKQNQARENAVLPRAKKIAEAIQKSGTPNLALEKALQELKDELKLKREIIPLGTLTEPVSPLVPVPGAAGGFVYAEYDLPRGLLDNPRSDTKDQVLKLYELQKPLEIGYAPLDKINKALFDEMSKDKEPKGKYVQILTNQPRTVFYIAVLRGAPDVSPFGFNMAMRNIHDQFFDRARMDAAKKWREDLMDQLRKQHKLDPPSDQVRNSFDSDATDR